MKPFRTWAHLAALLVPVLVFCGCGKPEVAPDDPSRSARAHLGDFVVAAGEPDAGNMIQPHLYLRNRDLVPYAESVRELTAGGTERNFPLPGCDSMKVEFFTGGANCCFGYYLLTACPDTEFAAYVAPLDGNVGEPVAALRAYPVSDPAFMYYSPEGQTAKDTLVFNRPDSPRLIRYVVFENGKWRADKRGELAAAYEALMKEAANGEYANPATKSVTVAYYMRMAGTPNDIVRKYLAGSLPRKYRKLSATIFADIDKAIAGFDPVRNMDITGR